jgi:hypothetical protein
MKSSRSRRSMEYVHNRFIICVSHVKLFDSSNILPCLSNHIHTMSIITVMVTEAIFYIFCDSPTIIHQLYRHFPKDLLILSKSIHEKYILLVTTTSSFQAERSTRRFSDREMRRGHETPAWIRIAPTQDEPHERIHQIKTCKWCATCKRWFFGSCVHLTVEHIHAFWNQTPTTLLPSANIATTPIIEDHTNLATSSNPLPNRNIITRTYFQGVL